MDLSQSTYLITIPLLRKHINCLLATVPSTSLFTLSVRGPARDQHVNCCQSNITTPHSSSREENKHFCYFPEVLFFLLIIKNLLTINSKIIWHDFWKQKGIKMSAPVKTTESGEWIYCVLGKRTKLQTVMLECAPRDIGHTECGFQLIYVEHFPDAETVEYISRTLHRFESF